jgi:Cu+-exporting ATPase
MTNPVNPKRKSRDPVCGMMVGDSVSAFKTGYLGRDYFFCSEGCLSAFAGNPDKYLKTKKERGRFRRFLDRLARANEEEFGSSGPQCCH